MSEQDDKMMGMLCHLLGIFTSFVGPLIIWLIKKDDSPFVDHHGKQALNFQFTILIGYIVSGILIIILIGFFLYFVVWVVAIVFGILATVASNKGEMYEYPVAIRFFK